MFNHPSHKERRLRGKYRGPWKTWHLEEDPEQGPNNQKMDEHPGDNTLTPLYSQKKEGRAGSKIRGGDTSTESTDSKRRKSVNTVLQKTAPQPNTATNSEELNQVTAMDTSKPEDDDFRGALGFNS